jgi:uncharacterized surface protein with fasciclin (FAS1) repeats
MINKLLRRQHSRYWILAGILLAECGFFTSCTGYNLDEIKPDWLGSSINQYLVDEGNYTNFVELIKDLDYEDVLSKTGSKTLFIADDDAFNRFYSNNPWGVRNYQSLSLAQKKLLLNGSMINNAYQTRTLSSTEGPKEGDCMRRPTAISIYDSVPRILPAEMPATKYWAKYQSRPEGILCLKDMTPVPMIHFLEKQLTFNKITNSDYDFLFNHKTTRQPGDASINGVSVEGQNIKCMNGFVHQMADVMMPLDNMAEIIRKNPSTSAYSKLVERYSAPYYSPALTSNYNRLYNANVDSVYQKRYFAKRSQPVGNDLTNYTAPDKTPVVGYLKFDPGWNEYFSEGVTTTLNSVALQENMAVMLVPSNTAMERYFNNEGGKVLRNYYGSWENVPDNVISKLINNNMMNSFISTVPSKFSTVLNDASNVMGITTDDIDSVYLGCNGAVYMTNKVFSPTAFSSVSFPALINDNMNIFYWGIEKLEYFAYLNSMESYFSFFIPTNKALLEYIDPVSFGQSTTKMFKFWYDRAALSDDNKVKASIWTYDVTTGTRKDSVGMATFSMIKNRLQDMLDNHIVIGDIEDGNTYYQTKGGGTIKVENVAGGAGVMKVSGGYQIENDKKVTVNEVYDESAEGNGKTYILDSTPIYTSKNSVYDIFNAHPEFKKFFDLMKGTTFFEKVRDKLYACGSTNVSLFNTYHYTVYVPTNESIQELQDAGKLPTWEQIDALPDGTAKDNLKAVVSAFVKYHIQDNSLYIGAGSSTGKYETALINPVSQRFYKLNVTTDNSGIAVTDLAGNVRHVTSDAGLRNLMAREYQYNNPDVAKATEIETSSFAVIHQIDKPLMYSTTQFGSNVPARNSKK